MSEATEAGDQLEREVTNVYRMLGYTVSANVSFEGLQIDLFASRRQPGAGETRLMIECKYKSSGTVSNEELLKLSNAFTEAGRQGGCHKAVLVTNAGFSAASKAFAANRPYLVLTTLKELEEETFDLFAAYGRSKREYQGRAIHSLYVPLQGQGRLPGRPREAEHFPDLEAELIRWVDTGEPGFLTIMADFGAGKTTLLERIKYHYCDLYERSQSRIKPLLFRAKDLHKFSNITDYVTSTVATEFRSVSDNDLIWRMLADGSFLLLIDGFDEVAQQVDAKTRRTYLATLSTLFNTPSHTIMTCRPTFFIGSEEYDTLIEEVLDGTHLTLGRPTTRELHVDRSAAVQRMTTDLIHGQRSRRVLAPIRALNLGRVEILPFSTDQIDAYLARRANEFLKTLGVDWKAIKDFLVAVYDIRDLMSRPILLDMIVRTVLSREIDVHDKEQRIGAAEIYEAYIRALLHRETDDRETRRMVSAKLRQAWVEQVALLMFVRDTLELTLADVVDLISRKRRAVEDAAKDSACTLDDEHLAADIVLTGFLMRDESGTYRFLHKSFLEYLIARHVATSILAETSDDEVSGSSLPADIIYFLGSFLVNDSELFKAMARRLRHTRNTDHWDSNIVGAIVSSGVAQEDFEVRSIRVTTAVAAFLRWRSADITDVSFAVKALKTLQFEECGLHKVTIEHATDEVALLHCKNHSITFASEASTLKIEGCAGAIVLEAGANVQELRSTASMLACEGTGRLGEVVVSGGSIKVDGELRLKHLTVVDAITCELDAFEFDRIELTRTKVELHRMPLPVGDGYFVARDCDVAMLAYAEGSAGGVLNSEFTRCRIAGLRVQTARNPTLHDCRGIALWDDQERQEKVASWRQEGSVLFIRRAILHDVSQRGAAEVRDVLQRAADMFPERFFLDWITHAREQYEERRPREAGRTSI